MNLPGCQQPPVKACSKNRSIGRLCEEVGACGGRIFFASGVAWTHAGRRFGLVTRTIVASAVAREPAANIFFSRSVTRQWRAFFTVVVQWLQYWTKLPVVARSERALSSTSPPAKVMKLTYRLPTCRVQVSISSNNARSSPRSLLVRAFCSARCTRRSRCRARCAKALSLDAFCWPCGTRAAQSW